MVSTDLKKMLVKLDHFPTNRGEKKKCLKPPSRIHHTGHIIMIPRPELENFWGDSLTITTFWGDQPAVNGHYNLQRENHTLSVSVLFDQIGLHGVSGKSSCTPLVPGIVSAADP